jgi:GT2 family glycosyltransferase
MLEWTVIAASGQVGSPGAEPSLPRASLIAVSYNAAAVLPGFLASVAELDYPEWECIVVDNASADRSSEIAREADIPNLRVVDTGANVGFGRACNVGVTKSEGELVVFLNPDMTMPADWLKKVVTSLVANSSIGAISPATFQPGELVELDDRLVDVTGIPGCAMVMKRESFDQLGGFDERIFLYWEDTDLCWRARLRGQRVVKDFSTYVVHERGGTGGGDRMAAEQIKNGVYVHLKLASPRKLVPYLFRTSGRTVVRFARTRERALIDAWLVNMLWLPGTLRLRYVLTRGVPREQRRVIEDTLLNQERSQRPPLRRTLGFRP